WSKVSNIKQMAQTVLFIEDHDLDFDALSAKADAASTRFNDLSAQVKAAEKRMAEIAVLKTHIINYSKTRDVYAGYKAAGYAKKYLAEHESDIIIHKAAKKAFDELGLKKLPTVKTLQAEYAALLTDKKAAYSDYQSAQKEMRELLIHRQNVVQFLGLDVPAVQKEKEHGRD
ncbi:MAG: relaxase/mobilization nuclease, partial [Oscillospiraceae bacterium]|nr:relaxase/mobilization nuclease [Oscillospiraceae bacterium]